MLKAVLRPAGTAIFATFCAQSAYASPLDYLHSHGAQADAIRPLTLGVLAISLAVVAIIAALLIGGVRRAGAAPLPGARLDVLPDEGGRNWLWIGVGLSSLALLFSVIWTVAVLAEIAQPPGKSSLTVEVTGKQWWWQVRYLSDDPSRIFTTANEIHIPVGRPVRIRLIGGDVIHSFWVPGLGGKTDLIPGQTNETWLQAREPGIYRGQCAEYCGVEHARMALLVIADPPATFAAWQAHQLRSPAPAPGHGSDLFAMHCGSCHAVRGTVAAGILGPDLSHLGTRHTLAAGMLPNDSAHLARWLDDPQALKPGALMQRPEISPPERGAIVAYLESLK